MHCIKKLGKAGLVSPLGSLLPEPVSVRQLRFVPPWEVKKIFGGTIRPACCPLAHPQPLFSSPVPPPFSANSFKEWEKIGGGQPLFEGSSLSPRLLGCRLRRRATIFLKARPPVRSAPLKKYFLGFSLVYNQK